jgi:hypothetical protein
MGTAPPHKDQGEKLAISLEISCWFSIICYLLKSLNNHIMGAVDNFGFDSFSLGALDCTPIRYSY